MGGDQEKKQTDEVLNSEISLTLSSKTTVQSDDDDETDTKRILLRTKRMVIDILNAQSGCSNLMQLLNTPATEEQEEIHMANVERLQNEKKQQESVKEGKDGSGDDQNKVLRTQRSHLNENLLPIEDMKKRVVRNLEKLASHDIVSEEDNYQAMVNIIARDIRNQRIYRKRRKQELSKLKQNMERLEQKSNFFEEQAKYYNEYVKSCLASLAMKANKKK